MNSTNILKLDVSDDKVSFASSIETARQAAEAEQYKLEETIQSVRLLKPECDKLDYALAASSGALCGLIAVSYTHLDVYKRQPSDPSILMQA